MTSTTGWAPTAAHSPAIAALDKSVYGDLSIPASRWRRWLSSPKTVAVAVGPVASPVAVAVAEPAGAGLFDVHRLAVAAGARRRGVGRWLVEVLGERHDLRLRLRETNAGGLAFARAVGFAAVALDRDGFGDCDAVVLVRPAEGG